MTTAPLKMKDLEANSGVGREAIRFYIKQGLLPEPSKPKRNVAHYSDEHVVRLKLIKRLQEERSMPLGQIKQIMNQADLSNLSSDTDLAAFEIAFLSLVNGNAPQKEVSLTQAAKQYGFSKAELTEMDKLGIISIMRTSRGNMLSFHDIGVLDKWSKIRGLGFEASEGYDFEFLKRYVEMTQVLAENEVQLFLNAYAHQPPNEGALMGMKGVDLVNELIAILHTRAVAEEVSRQVEE